MYNLHAGGRRFESCTAHFFDLKVSNSEFHGNRLLQPRSPPRKYPRPIDRSRPHRMRLLNNMRSEFGRLRIGTETPVTLS